MGNPISLGRRNFALLLVGVVLFTLYGSYVPFRYHYRNWGDTVAAFQWAMSERLWPESRADYGANMMLGYPFGFFLLGWLRVDRLNRIMTTLGVALALLPLCASFAAVVEFGQLYFSGRTCAGSDVVAQTLGATLGMATWTVAGQWLTSQARQALAHPNLSGGAVRLLGGYLALLALVEWLPLDLTASPADLYRRVRDGYVTLMPFGELNSHTVDPLKKGQDWCELLLLHVPVGMLLIAVGGRWRRWESWTLVLGFGLAVGLVLETGQWFVVSRHPSTSDVLISATGILLGWAATRALVEPSARRLPLTYTTAYGAVWLVLLGVVHWQPFDFDIDLVGARLSRVDWLPLSGQAEKNYLWALNEVLAKFMLFPPLGALVVWASAKPELRSAEIFGATLCGLVAGLLEVGQLATPLRYGSPTDVLFGVVGGWLGAAMMRRVLTATAANGYQARGELTRTRR